MSNLPPHVATPHTPQMSQNQLPQPPRSRTWLVVLVIGFASVCFLLCCGGGALLMNFGFGIIEVEIQDQLAVTPEFQEHVGSIESFEMNWTRSFKDNDDDTFAYDFEGSTGSGYVTVRQHTDSDGDEVIESAELHMDDGRRIPIEIVPEL